MTRHRRPASPTPPSPCSTPSPSPTPPSHPIKPFHLPLSPIRYLLSLPSQLLFALTGLFGMAQYARQIIRVTPRRITQLELKGGRRKAFAEWVEENTPSLKGSFAPSWWLPNGHFQTIFTVVGNFNTVDKVDYERTYTRAPDGGTIGLDFAPPNHENLPDDTPTIVICHGLSGGSYESYVRNVVVWVIKPKSDGGLGARAVVVNFRGCAGVPVTSPRLYSAGTTVDLALSLHYLRATFPSSPLHGVGFSLGASVLSRYLGETSERCLLSSGCVLGCPWDIPVMSAKLENHWFISRVYSPAMGTNLVNLFFRGYDSDPSVWEDQDDEIKSYLPALKAIRGKKRSLRQVDEVMVCKVGGPRGIGLWPFEDADAYYAWASPKNVILGVKRPLLALNAFDDPIIDGASLPIDAFQSSSHICAAITGAGGHLGWFSGPFFGRTSKLRWSLRPVSEFLVAACRDLPSTDIGVKTRSEEGGWEWVVENAHEISGVGGDGTAGWRVLKEGEVREGEGKSGVLQGL